MVINRLKERFVIIPELSQSFRAIIRSELRNNNLIKVTARLFSKEGQSIHQYRTIDQDRAPIDKNCLGDIFAHYKYTSSLGDYLPVYCWNSFFR